MIRAAALGEGVVLGQGDGITDGMKVDRKGNIYSTSGAGPGIVRITSPELKSPVVTEW